MKIRIYHINGTHTEAETDLPLVAIEQIANNASKAGERFITLDNHTLNIGQINKITELQTRKTARQ